MPPASMAIKVTILQTAPRRIRLPRTAGTSSQQAYVEASNAGADDHFGISVTLSADGDTLAIGASSEASSGWRRRNRSNDAAGRAEAVYVFTRSAGIWSQQAYVERRTRSDHHFGCSVALSADSDTLAMELSLRTATRPA